MLGNRPVSAVLRAQSFLQVVHEKYNVAITGIYSCASASSLLHGEFCASQFLHFIGQFLRRRQCLFGVVNHGRRRRKPARPIDELIGAGDPMKAVAVSA